MPTGAGPPVGSGYGQSSGYGRSTRKEEDSDQELISKIVGQMVQVVAYQHAIKENVHLIHHMERVQRQLWEVQGRKQEDRARRMAAKKRSGTAGKVGVRPIKQTDTEGSTASSRIRRAETRQLHSLGDPRAPGTPTDGVVHGPVLTKCKLLPTAELEAPPRAHAAGRSRGSPRTQQPGSLELPVANADPAERKFKRFLGNGAAAALLGDTADGRYPTDLADGLADVPYTDRQQALRDEQQHTAAPATTHTVDAVAMVAPYEDTGALKDATARARRLRRGVSAGSPSVRTRPAAGKATIASMDDAMSFLVVHRKAAAARPEQVKVQKKVKAAVDVDKAMKGDYTDGDSSIFEKFAYPTVMPAHLSSQNSHVKNRMVELGWMQSESAALERKSAKDSKPAMVPLAFSVDKVLRANCNMAEVRRQSMEKSNGFSKMASRRWSSSDRSSFLKPAF